MDGLETKFTKSGANRRKENRALRLLTRDLRFQVVSTPIKRRIIELLPVAGEWGIQTFDAVMTPEPRPPITLDGIQDQLAAMVLVEMKTTTKSIKNSLLNGFFFGATEREYSMARALGEQYRFAFVVLNNLNDYGRPFCVLLTLAEVERRTRQKRTQYQVNFRTNMSVDPYLDEGAEGASPELLFGPPSIHSLDT
jgi:hypothetical protein